MINGKIMIDEINIEDYVNKIARRARNMGGYPPKHPLINIFI